MNRAIATAFLTRSAGVWVGIRIVVSALLLLVSSNPLRLSIGTTMIVCAVSVAVGYVTVHLNHERDLLGNLGIRRRALGVVFLLPAVIGEVLVRVVARAS